MSGDPGECPGHFDVLFIAAVVMTLKTEKSEVLPPIVCEALLAVNVGASVTSRMCPAIVLAGFSFVFTLFSVEWLVWLAYSG
jgi:hypothetical protein